MQARVQNKRPLPAELKVLTTVPTVRAGSQLMWDHEFLDCHYNPRQHLSLFLGSCVDSRFPKACVLVVSVTGGPFLLL